MHRWRITNDGARQVSMSHTENALHLDVHEPNPTGPYIRIYNYALSFIPGQEYTIRFRARAELPRRIITGVQWRTENLSTSLPLENEAVISISNEWRTFYHTFTAKEPWGNVFFEIGRAYRTIDLNSVSVKAGKPDIVTVIADILRDNIFITFIIIIISIFPIYWKNKVFPEWKNVFLLLITIILYVDYWVFRSKSTNWNMYVWAFPIFLADITGFFNLFFWSILFWPSTKK